jgi:CheY-like chemotaxis protein
VSGLQLLSEWRSDPRTAELPVLVLTSKDLTPEERTYLRENVGALFSKQGQWQDALIKRIQRAVPSAPAVNQ